MSLRLRILLAVVLGLPPTEARAGMESGASLDGSHQIAAQYGERRELASGVPGEDTRHIGPGLPFDSSAGHTIVSLKSWPTFPILRTESSREWGEKSAGEYWVHFRERPFDPVRVLVVSPTGEILGSEVPSTHGGPAFRPCDIRSHCGLKTMLGAPYGQGGRLKVSPTYATEVWDPRTESRVESELGDSSYIAVFEFDTDVRPGNYFLVLLGGVELYRERIPGSGAGFSHVVYPLIRPLTSEERFTLFVDRQIRARRGQGATEEEIARYREELERYRRDFTDGTKK